MNNFSLNAALVIDTFNNELLTMINVKITRLDGKFAIRSLNEQVSATDGTITVPAFRTETTPNQREIKASFTTDAFTVFTGPVKIEFGYEKEVLGIFENFDPNHDIAPLDPIFAGVTAPNADNQWLQDFITP
jgi:hypothetical protein